MKAINGAVVGAVALGAALLLSCGSSAEQPGQAPRDAQQLDSAATSPTPAAEATHVEPEPTGEDHVGTPAPEIPTATPESETPVADEPDLTATGVGYIEETYIDDQRPTPPSGSFAGRNSRVLRTLVFYPAVTEATATGPVEDAQPATAGSPYPLVLFAHGFGSHPEAYRELLSAVAAGGYVVAAPEFPLTSASSPSSPDPRDTVSQPGDLSFLIDAFAEQIADPQRPLFELVDFSRIAATGHSNGAVTVLGISANSCCRDERIDVTVAMAGPAADFNGEYDFTDTPPILFIHGTEDRAIVYEASAQIFNEVTAVKGLLTLNGGNHSTWLGSGHEFFGDVTTTLLDFLAMALKSDSNATARLAQPRSSPNAELVFAPQANSGVTVEIDTVEANRTAWVEPSGGLVNGQTVTVNWSGYLPGQSVNIVQCSQGALRDSTACDFTHAKILHPNPSGDGSVEMVIIAGPVGTGVCDATVDDCVIAVNDSGILEPDATIRIPISFAP